MTGMDAWDEAIRAREAHEQETQEQERHAIAQLLRARGLDELAALVACSGYRSDHVDNWNGGQYESVFEVPPAYFDRVDEQSRAALAAVVGTGHFSGIDVAVQRVPVTPGWEEAMLREIVERRQQPQTVGVLPALLAGSTVEPSGAEGTSSKTTEPGNLAH